MNPLNLIPPDTKRKTALFLLVAILLAMIVIVAWMAVRVAYGAPLAIYGHHGPALLPDMDVTPGAVRTLDRNEVCNGGSTKQFRHTTEKMKAAVYAAYGVNKNYPLPDAGSGTFKAPLYESDHLVSLELGGADEAANLWPQPYYQNPGAHEKDAVENYLHREVCAGRMDLQEAQRSIATDWYAIYLRMNAPPAGSAWAD